jgi:hypothetical protein
MGAYIREHRPLVALLLAGGAVLMIIVAFVALIEGSLFDYPVARPAFLQVTSFAPDGAIARENQLPGSASWQLDVGANTTFIQGYAGAVSALPGASVPLYISSMAPSDYRLDVYRIGWYNGLGGRLMQSITGLHSGAQGTWNDRDGLVGCGTCSFDPGTRLVDAHWQPSYTLTIGSDWLSGMYLIKMTTANHAEGYIPLVVRDDTTPTAALASFPVNTYQAYNFWGGYSLYGRDDLHGHVLSDERAFKVSFNRPYDRDGGAGDFLTWDVHAVRWLERSAMDVSYTTDVDFAEHPESLLRHRIFIDIGHDEYWSKAMRDGAEAARDKGVSLAFLGANDSYWQMRYQPDANGDLDRTIVCYKGVSYAHDHIDQLKNDPYYTKYRDEVTAAWRDPAVHRPEWELLGLAYHSIFGHNYYPQWVVPIGPLDPLEQGTGLQPGMHLPGGLVGYEYDGLPPVPDSTKKLVVLALSPIENRYGKKDEAATAYYRAASGALVFDAGSIWWSWGLDESVPIGTWQTPYIHGNQMISNLMTNILRAMLAASPRAPGATSATPSGTPTPHPPSATPTPAPKH